MIPINSVLPDFTGRTIDNGQILLLKRIGSGVHGAVYKAARFSPPERINLSLAVKCLLKPSLDSRNARWTDREVALHSLVSRHPNIVTLHDVFEDERHVYLVLDFSPGGDLFTAMTENHIYFKNNELIKTAFIQLIDAVQHCHVNGVYHRDLKPENILCSKDGSQIQLADFSLATDNPITDQRRIGTSFYMSPECFGDQSFQCEHYSSAHTDIWSLGVILVNMISGRNPWARVSCRDPCFSAYLDDPHHFFRDILPVSEGVNGLLQRIFHLDPSSRISLTDLRAAIMAMNDFYVSDDDLVHDSHVMRLSDWNYGARVPSDKHSARGSDDACSSDSLSSMIEYEFVGSSGTSARQSDISVGRDQRSGASPEHPRRRLVALNLSPQSSSSSGEGPITPESHAVDPEDVVPDLPAGESLGQLKTSTEISRQVNAVKKDFAPFRFISVVRSLMVR